MSENIPATAVDHQAVYENFCRCADIAQRLDALNPTLPGAFTGTVADRIQRQLMAQGVLQHPVF